MSNRIGQAAERGNGPSVLLSIVVYNGSERWTAAGTVTGLLEPWSMATQLVLAPFQGWDYVLLSLQWLRSSGGLVRLPLGNRTAATLRLQAEYTPADLLARFRREWVRFDGNANAPTRRVLHVWTGALLERMGGAESILPALAELEGLKGGKNMATVSEALFDEWFAGVRAEHLAEGISQERARGFARLQQERARGFARLRRQAAIKFGAHAADRLSALLGSAVADDRMEGLGDRVSDWIVECEQGEDLLARVSAWVGNVGGGS